MPFSKGEGGRPKGAKNKVPTDLREAVLASLHDRGGVDYLNSLSDKLFVALLAKVIPKEIDATLTANDPITIMVKRAD